MTAHHMKTAINWASKPEPWCWIGAAWAIEVRRQSQRP
jgi:hypothetical protein